MSRLSALFLGTSAAAAVVLSLLQANLVPPAPIGAGVGGEAAALTVHAGH